LLRRKVLRTVFILIAAIVILALTHDTWLGWVGDSLVSASDPVKADMALVLAGDWRGNRIKTAGDLVRAGYVPGVLLTGPMELYGLNEADLAVQFAVANGYQREWFHPIKIQATSTFEEARGLASEIERRGIRKLLIVTSNFHTSRAEKIFRKALPETIEIRMIAAPDPYFQPHDWWHTREGWKTVFYEFSKTASRWIGI
jgi:uncharacterized SAM-binding protein YcdF (DUF218 family)